MKNLNYIGIIGNINSGRNSLSKEICCKFGLITSNKFNYNNCNFKILPIPIQNEALHTVIENHDVYQIYKQ